MTDQRSRTASAAALEAARQGAVLFDRSALGHLVFRGETRLDLVHRMSTQAVKHLAPGQGAATVLTTDIGRIIDRLLLYADTDSVLVVTGEENADNVARYLMRFVFFNDDFQIEDRSAGTAIFGVYGSQAASRLAEAVGVSLALPLHHWQRAALGSIPLSVHRTDPVAGDGYLLLVPAGRRDEVWTVLTGCGMQAIDEASFDYLRIESCLPRFGHELTQDYIPLETDLWADVSFKKGCYIGQEIIARLESRGRLAKRLALLRLAEPVPPGSQLEADGKSAGTVTSVAQGPRETLALAYLKTGAVSQSTALTVAGEAVAVVSDWVRQPAGE